MASQSLSLDQAILLPHLRRQAELGFVLGFRERQLLERDDTARDAMLPSPRAQGGEPMRLRGLPPVGAAASVSPGTDPAAALLAKEARR